MRLVSLTSNQSSFKDIFFHNGLNIIYGIEHEVHSTKEKNYNGVGKTMVLHLIHFCLGCDKIKAFEKEIPGWEFMLTFEDKNETHTAVRNTSNQSTIVFDNKEMELDDFRDTMKHMIFIQEDVPNLTWMSLFSRFARRHYASYLSFDKVHNRETDYAALLVNCYLLGIDIHLVEEKNSLREKQLQVNASVKSLNEDPIPNPNIREDFYKHKIEELETQLNAFQVSENYHEIQRQADDLHRKKKELENKRVLRENNIESIQKSIQLSETPDYQYAYNVYELAAVEIPDMVRVSIDQVNEFHRSLLESRRQRLSNEQMRLQKELSAIEEELKVLGDEMDKLLSYLNTHRALDEYVAITKQIEELKEKIRKISDYRSLMQSYETKKLELKKEIANQNAKAGEYIVENQSYLSGLTTSFRQYAERFYPQKPCGLTLENNTNDNAIRFNLAAHIESDSSDGINSVKIFCYDLMLLSQKVSGMRFLCHDGRLFGNIDPRQRAELFRIVDRYCHENGVQYICSLAKDQLASIHAAMPQEEYERIFREESFILRLTDESPEGKLLGIQVDMNID